MADSLFETIEPRTVWKRFAELKNTPRPSKKEAQVLAYLKQWADDHGFQSRSDAIGNLCVQVPATPGHEQAPIVILQNHVDIVTADSEDAPPDANSEAGKIPVQRVHVGANGEFTEAADGDWVLSPFTTLGADNGIGCTYAMAVAEADDLVHPPLELLFTVDEEQGMSGALNAEPNALGMQGKLLINLDTEDDDELTMGCAGGKDSHLTWKAARGGLDDDTVVRKLELRDLRGGHSGVEINSGRANAIRLLARALHQIDSPRIVSIAGGEKRNAIPRFAHAIISMPTDAVDDAIERLNALAETLNRQFDGRDLPIRFALVDTDAPADNAFTAEASTALVDLLLAIPTGVYEMTAEIPDLPETSNNLAIISTHDDTVSIECSSRSSMAPGIEDVQAALHAVARLGGAAVETGNGYPGWKPNLNSNLLKVSADVYRRLFDAEPKIHAIHAGLECGVLAGKIDDLDCISFGPNIRGNHAPGEHVQISSVQKSYALLVEVLKALATGAK